MNFIFRLDCNEKNGAGHFYRCLSLATYFKKKKSKVFFLTTKLDNKFKLILNKYGVNHFENRYLINSNKGEIKFIIDTVSIINTKIHYLIIDNYKFKYSFQKKIQQHFNKIIIITDLYNRKYYCDILIDPNYGRKKEHYKNSITLKKMLLGFKYYPIRFDFNKNLKNKSIRIKKNSIEKNNILISLGAYGSEILILKIIFCLFSLDKNFNIIILSGKRKYKILENFIQKNLFKSKIIVVNYQTNLAKYYLRSNIYIGSSGVTLYEALYFGLFPFPIVTAANQKKAVVDMCRDKKIQEMYSLNLNMNRLKDSLLKFISLNTKDYINKIDKLSKLIDNDGPNRIYKLLK